MPTYGYSCPECGHEYEKMQKISDDTLAKCPECGALGRRVISGGAGLIFKGSGFYITDYKRAGEKQTESGDSGEKPKKKDESKEKKSSGPDKPKPKAGAES